MRRPLTRERERPAGFLGNMNCEPRARASACAAAMHPSSTGSRGRRAGRQPAAARAGRGRERAAAVATGTRRLGPRVAGQRAPLTSEVGLAGQPGASGRSGRRAHEERSRLLCAALLQRDLGPADSVRARSSSSIPPASTQQEHQRGVEVTAVALRRRRQSWRCARRAGRERRGTPEKAATAETPPRASTLPAERRSAAPALVRQRCGLRPVPSAAIRIDLGSAVSANVGGQRGAFQPGCPDIRRANLWMAETTLPPNPTGLPLDGLRNGLGPELPGCPPNERSVADWIGRRHEQQASRVAEARRACAGSLLDARGQRPPPVPNLPARAVSASTVRQLQQSKRVAVCLRKSDPARAHPAARARPTKQRRASRAPRARRGAPQSASVAEPRAANTNATLPRQQAAGHERSATTHDRATARHRRHRSGRSSEASDNSPRIARPTKNGLEAAPTQPEGDAGARAGIRQTLARSRIGEHSC
jgi:hypothetical protein